MRIAIINKHPEDYLGGSEIQCDLFAKHLKLRGHEILYIAIKGLKERYNRNYEVLPVKQRSGEIAYVCEKFAPEIIYWRYNKKIFSSSMKKLKKLNVPIVFGVSHINDFLKWSYKPVNTGSRIMNKMSNLYKIVDSAWNHEGFKYIDGLTVNNYDYLNKVKINNQIYIPNSMITNCIPFSWDRPFCLWVANIKKSKNPELFVELAQKLQNIDMDFLMVGFIQDKFYSYLEDKSIMPKNLYYLGPKTLTEVNGMLKESLFLVHTCNPEGFPNIMIQAWLQGKPTVCLYFDPSGYLESKGIGLYSRNLHRFVFDVNRLLEDKSLREKMGQKAKDFAEINFSIENNVAKLEVFLKQLVEIKMLNN